MEEAKKKKLFTTNFIVKVATLSAFATVIMALKFPLPVFPSFYKLEFSEVVVMIGGFALGPVAAVLTEAIKVLLNFMIDGTVTAGIGELSNFLMGCSLVVPASLIYSKMRTRKGAMLSCAAGFVSLLVISAVLNYYLLIPAYASAFKLHIDSIVEMGTKLNAGIIDLRTLILFATVPFNAIKGACSVAITILVYKSISRLLSLKTQA